MPPLVPEILRDWSRGVVTAAEPDQIPPNASPRGRNSALTSLGGASEIAAGGMAVVQKRRGLTTVNATALSGTPAILGQYEFNRLNSGVYTRYHLLVGDDGTLGYVNDSTGALTNLATPFTAGTYIPDFATANNLAFVANGQDQPQKTDGVTVWRAGMVRPTVGTLAGAAGAAGLHNGTYELRVTFYNSNTGQESSASDTATATVVVANQKIDWTAIPTSSDAQVTDRKLYVRNTSTMANFKFVVTLAGNVATTVTTNVADTALGALAPDTEENNSPPSGVNFLAVHLNRLFYAGDATNPGRVYYSKVGFPESVDPDNFIRVNEQDGQRITALHVAHDRLIIMKRTGMYALIGSSPETWVLERIDAVAGTSSHRSMTTVEGVTYFWAVQYGLMGYDGGGAPYPIALPLIAPSIASDVLQFSQLNTVCIAPDTEHQRVLIALAASGETRNTLTLPYNYRVHAFEADQWTALDTASLAVVRDSNDIPQVYVGGYKGQVWRWWGADNDGVPSGTLSGTVTSSTTSVLTDSAAAFVTAGAGLAQRYVTAVNTDGSLVQRRRIGSNTATTITLDTGVTFSSAPAAGWTYIVGAIDFQWDTAWRDSGLPFHKKRYEFLYSQLKTSNTAITVNVDLFFSYLTEASSAKSLTFTTQTSSALWDTSLWDSAAWGSESVTNKRTRVGKTGRAWRARYRNRNANEPLTLLKVGMRASLRTDKLG